MRASGFVTAALAGVLGILTLVASSSPAAEDVFTAMRATRAVPPTAVPEVTLPTADGGSLALSAFRGKVVIVGFFVTT